MPRGDRRFRRVHLVEAADFLPGVSRALTSALASTNANHGSPEEGISAKRPISSSAPAGCLTELPISTLRRSIRRYWRQARQIRGRKHDRWTRDKIHPKRVGYLAMAMAIDRNLLAPIPVPRR
jgi:hypothetical protein